MLNIREIVGLAPVIPVLAITELESAVPLARALAAGGLRALEITLGTPVALAAIEAMRRAVPERSSGQGPSRVRWTSPPQAGWEPSSG